MKTPITKIDDLFSLRMGLTKTGDVKLEMDYVEPEIFEQTMNNQAPDFEGTFQITTMLRYLKTTGGEILERANGFIR